MTSTTQREAARRNVKNAQAVARDQHTLQNPPKSTLSALGKEANAVRCGDAPTRREMEQQPGQVDVKGHSKMGKDELKRAVARAKSGS